MSDRRRAWARALFEAAPDAAAREAFGAALGGIASLLDGDLAFAGFFRDPVVPVGSKTSLLAAALGSGSSRGSDGSDGSAGSDGSGSGGSDGAAAVFGRFCLLLAEKGRVGLVPEIAAAYTSLLDASLGRERIEVECARGSPPEAIERLRAAWQASTGSRECIVTVTQNPGLLGGYRLRAGSLRIDYSIAGRLERLRRDLARPLGSREPAAAEREEG